MIRSQARQRTTPWIAGVSTPEQKSIGSPEQKYINDAGKKAPLPR
jgi:hypothetical protein